MTKLLSKNSKMAKSGGDKYAIFDFAIPAYKSNTGLVTCPMAGSCAKSCYAQNGSYAWKPVQDAFERRLATIVDGTFEDKIEREIRTKLKTADRRKQQLVIRIHSSGDFFNKDYVDTWMRIVQLFPTAMFYAYTKALPYFKNQPRPNNFVVIFSEGGKGDRAIDTESDRHARVFETQEALEAAGYANASKDDSVAFASPNNKIGLIYHGPKSKKWATA